MAERRGGFRWRQEMVNPTVIVKYFLIDVLLILYNQPFLFLHHFIIAEEGLASVSSRCPEISLARWSSKPNYPFPSNPQSTDLTAAKRTPSVSAKKNTRQQERQESRTTHQLSSSFSCSGSGSGYLSSFSLMPRLDEILT